DRWGAGTLRRPQDRRRAPRLTAEVPVRGTTTGAAASIYPYRLRHRANGPCWVPRPESTRGSRVKDRFPDPGAARPHPAHTGSGRPPPGRSPAAAGSAGDGSPPPTDQPPPPAAPTAPPSAGLPAHTEARPAR